MTTPHKHAALIKQWADDTSLPVWYWSRPLSEWQRPANPGWDSSSHYAIGDRPTQPPRKMCVLAGVEFPMPETAEPHNGTRYYVPDPRDEFMPYFSPCWSGTSGEKHQLAFGLIHLSIQAALQHGRALMAANKQAIEGAK